MIPRRVELSNFLSFGERQTFEFTDDEALWVLCGGNGVGKSAIFDAMTFALFGEHRGGGLNANQLIRHGANSFLVVFEFEFNHTVYAIERGRDRRAAVQRVRRAVGATWEDIDLSPYPVRDRIRGWAEATLGLDFGAFTASVMLRQGEADRIITAPPRYRMDFLRRIIGAERYERLHERVHNATRNLRARLDALTADRDRVPEVSPAQLEESAAALQRAAEQLTAARDARDAAAVRVEQARRWNELECQRQRLEQQLREADARAVEGEQIRADHARFEELGRVLPAARELVGLWDGLKQLDAEFARLTGELQDVTTARDEAARQADAARERGRASQLQADTSRREAERLRDAIARTRRLVTLADEVAGLEEQERQFADDLDARSTAADAEVCRLTEELRGAGERRAGATSLLQAAETRRREFECVEVGAKCLRCGQPVTREHADRERADLDDQIERHRRDRDAAQATRNVAETALKNATVERDRLAGETRDRDRIRDRLDLQRRNLSAQGITTDAATLRTEIEEQERQAQTLEEAATTSVNEQRDAETAATRYDKERQQHQDCVRALQGQLNDARTAQTRDAARRDALLDQIPPAWRGRFPTVTLDDVNRDQFEFDQLRRSDITGRFRQLAEDVARRDEWKRQRNQILHDIEQIPAEARCPVAGAQQVNVEAGRRLTEAESAHAAARDRDRQLRRDADRRRELTEQHRQLDRDHRLHGTLADLLGPNGLQRDLVRSAERDIVRYANDTVRNISCGDLTIELDETEDGPDRAFALRVRRADDPTPIGVHFLSGSQKFRVAVAVALAIGRFASGQARPLESVIIDEGFGSLDRDGLQVMGEELRNLQKSQSLRRLILVSHQEEFTARFPVGYRLEPGENGTTATRFRREGGGAV